MTEQKRKPGRPATGVLSPIENKQALIAAGGRVFQYRIKPPINTALHALEASGEFKSATDALDTALAEAAKRRKLIQK